MIFIFLYSVILHLMFKISFFHVEMNNHVLILLFNHLIVLFDIFEYDPIVSLYRFRHYFKQNRLIFIIINHYFILSPIDLVVRLHHPTKHHIFVDSIYLLHLIPINHFILSKNTYLLMIHIELYLGYE